jgi:dynein heavy chain
VSSSLKLYNVYKEVDPLKKKVELMDEECKKMERELNETQELLVKLSKDLKELNERREEKQSVLNNLTEQANLMNKRLNAAKKLITGLGREKIRWTEDRENILAKIIKLIGDCLICSSFLSYAGPFGNLIKFNY